jgi:hypothetical protein
VGKRNRKRKRLEKTARKSDLASRKLNDVLRDIDTKVNLILKHVEDLNSRFQNQAEEITEVQIFPPNVVPISSSTAELFIKEDENGNEYLAPLKKNDGTAK